ncbi:hypothetical protein KUTeg_014140 [Tegillarca granosa]|uniref:Endoplasmic reticulum lectin 1 n=1 Tax=Tegillarca granosa TaxID=220873 RepID=A0ABQ9EZB7_TEGGR|nr:hypothetical protein KUTeg_014140 [Tegillarca granosa]
MLYVLVITISIILEFTTSINPFMDSELHAIDWVGTSIDSVGDNVLLMKTIYNEEYKCILPDDPTVKNEDAKQSYNGPTPEELLSDLFTQSSCSYRIESYWNYELCHGKHLRQYHESKELSQKKPKIQEFYLGFGEQKTKDGTKTSKTEEKPIIKETKIKSRKIDGITLPYFEFNMTDGTLCDLINEPRQVRLQYICQPDGRGEIYELKETSSCEYEVIVLTSLLCSHPEFKPKNPPVNKITCHAMEGSPAKPKELTKWNKEKSEFNAKVEFIKHVSTKDLDEEEEEEPEPNIPDKPTVNQRVDTTLGETTDKQVLREFLSGDYCLQGGSGWWMHEFCFGRYARQFHDDKDGRTVIFLGRWNEEKHLKWLKLNPSKAPKAVGSRRSLTLLYTEGDVCDITGRKRHVEVRLKCIQNVNQPHAVSIYLIEPKTCEYILGVESPILCSVIDKADKNGLIKDFVP